MLIYLCIYIHTFLNCIFSSPVLLWLPWIKGWLLPQPHLPQIDPPPPLCHHRCLNSTLDHVICWNPSEDSLAGHIRHVEIWPCFSPFSLLLPWFHGHMELCTISPNLDVLFVFLSSLEYSSPPPLFPGCSCWNFQSQLSITSSQMPPCPILMWSTVSCDSSLITLTHWIVMGVSCILN